MDFSGWENVESCWKVQIHFPKCFSRREIPNFQESLFDTHLYSVWLQNRWKWDVFSLLSKFLPTPWQILDFTDVEPRNIFLGNLLTKCDHFDSCTIALQTKTLSELIGLSSSLELQQNLSSFKPYSFVFFGRKLCLFSLYVWKFSSFMALSRFPANPSFAIFVNRHLRIS